jgi:metal-dependent amidase/aminoacylase/carboxypeptidase family protein
MVFLGMRPEGDDPVAPVHSNRMILNESAMTVGIALHAAMALRLLDPNRMFLRKG